MLALFSDTTKARLYEILHSKFPHVLMLFALTGLT